MVLVATKVDLNDDAQVSTAEGLHKAKQFGCPFIEVSSKSNRNVKDPFIELVREIRRAKENQVILVIGTHGRLCPRVLEALLKNPGNPTVLTTYKNSAQKHQYDSLSIKCVYFDFTDLSSYDTALEGVHSLLLVTGETVDMIRYSKNLVDAAARKRVKHIVHIGAFYQPASPSSKLVNHCIWHMMIEKYIEASGISWTHINPNIFTQFLLCAFKDNTLTFFTGDAKVGFVDCDDVADAVASVLTKPQQHKGKTYFLSSESFTMQEVASIFSKVLGRPVQYNYQDPERVLILSAKEILKEPAYLTSGIQFFKLIAAGELPDIGNVYDNIESLTGHKPTTIEQFILRNIDNFQAKYTTE